MKTTPHTSAGLALDTHSSPTRMGRIASSDGQLHRARPLMRKYEVAHLTSSGDIADFTRIAPATPAFEDNFAAFGRGAIVATQMGPVAVEDLLPGDMVRTSHGTFEKLLWRGTMQIVPGAQNHRPEMGTMTRITADALGLGRPAPDLVLGPAARMLHSHHGVRTLTGSDAAFVPVRDFIDGSSIIELRPIAPVHVYQLGFERHERITVNGIDVETLHPGAPHTLQVRHDMRAVFMSLFPHKRDINGFGTMCHPRIRLRDLDVFAVA